MTPIPDRPWTRHVMFVVAALLLLSSGAHGVLGWKMLHAALVDIAAPPDIVRTVAIGWFLGSAAMVAFGLVVLSAWRRARRGDGSGLQAAAIVAAVYLLFGLGAFLFSGFNTHFLLLFMIPAGLLGWAVRAALPSAGKEAA